MTTSTWTAAVTPGWCDLTAYALILAERFEAPDAIRRMLVTTWSLLYSMGSVQLRKCGLPMA